MEKIKNAGKSPLFYLCFIFLSICGILWQNIKGREMKNLIMFMVVLFSVSDGVAAAQSGGRGRVSMTNRIMAAPRATVASKNSLNAMAATNAPATSAALAVTPEQAVPAVKDVDRREKEKNICLSNNIGVGNTFVWASKYSNTQNYVNMVEDVEEPENNVCFVKVGLKSADNRVDLSDINTPYYEMGREIACGAWADEGMIEQRILDAKKTARVWGTIGGSIGGAGLGVGAMELFGNKLIGGKVEGQKSLQGDQLLRSQLLALKDDNIGEYNRFVGQLKILKSECNKDVWKTVSDSQVKSVCEKYDGVFDLAQ